MTGTEVEVRVDSATTTVAKEALVLQMACTGFKITSHNEYIAATDKLKEIKERMKQLDDLRRSMTKPLDDSKTKIMKFFRAPAEALMTAEKAVKAAILRFQQAQEAEAWRKREAERKRVEEEKEAAIVAAAEVGDVERVEELIGTPEPILPAVVPPAIPKVDGVQTRKVWKWRLADFAQVPREYLKLDEATIGAVVRAKQGNITIPGIEVYSEDVIASGRM